MIADSSTITGAVIPFGSSAVAGFFMGMFLRRLLKFLVIIIGLFIWNLSQNILRSEKQLSSEKLCCLV
jgi:uncharacterized membrane protein (Fun14 family)